MSLGEGMEGTGEQPCAPLLAAPSTSCSPPSGARAPSPLGPEEEDSLTFRGNGER